MALPLIGILGKEKPSEKPRKTEWGRLETRDTQDSVLDACAGGIGVDDRGNRESKEKIEAEQGIIRKVDGFCAAAKEKRGEDCLRHHCRCLRQALRSALKSRW